MVLADDGSMVPRYRSVLFFLLLMGSAHSVGKDIVITETGTSSFALPDTALPSHSTYLAQVLWGAIGWSVGACLGAALADKEAGQKRRVVHFVGDGSLALVGPMLFRNVKF